MGHIRENLFLALAKVRFDDEEPADYEAQTKHIPIPTENGAELKYVDENKKNVIRKRNAIFRLAMIRAANFVKKTKQEDISGGELEELRVAIATVQLYLGHDIFHGRHAAIPSGVDDSFFDNEPNSTQPLKDELTNDWPCI